MGGTGYWVWIHIILRPKTSWGPTITEGVYGDQKIKGVLAQAHLIVGPVSLWTHPVVISPVPECIILIDILNNWQNPHIGSMICGVRVFRVEKAKWRPIPLSLRNSPQENSKPKAILHPWRDCRGWQHHQELERCTSSGFYPIPIQLAYVACAGDRRILENDSGWSWA